MPFGGESAGGDSRALDRVLAAAHLVRVREMPGESPALFEERDPLALAALREALHIADSPGLTCMCWGDVALDFFTTGDRPLTTVTLHHGYSIRWDGWPQHALLADGLRALEWLAVRGVPAPLHEYRAAEQRRIDADRTARLWVSQIPEPLMPFSHLFLDTAATADGLTPPRLTEVRALLLAAYPNSSDRILRLCRWHAAGSGAHSAHPAHERIPAQFLDLEHAADIATALELADHTATTGLIRYLLSWPTRNRVATLLTALSPTTRHTLLIHTRDPRSRIWLQRRISRLE